MANVIRYKRDQPTKRGLKKGNAVVGTGEENYGPTSTTGYVAGIAPPEGGYVVYTLSGENDPAIYVASNNTDLINIARTLGGGELNYLEAKNYLRRRFNTWVLDSIPDNTVTDGLKLHLDAKNQSSFLDNMPTSNLIYTNNNVYQIGSYSNFPILFPGEVINGSSQGAMSWADHCRWYNETIPAGTTISISGWYMAYNSNPSTAWQSSARLIIYSSAGYGGTVCNPGAWNTWTYFELTYNVTQDTTSWRLEDAGYDYYNSSDAPNTAAYTCNVQIETTSIPTPFTTGSRSQNPIWKDISGDKKSLGDLRVLGAHHSGYEYPPFYNYLRTNCQMTNEPSVNDLPANWPVEQVVEEFDLVIADEYVWAMNGSVIEWMKELVDAGVNCIGVGNDQRGTIFVSGYNSNTRQSHDIRVDSKSPFGLQGRIFSYGSGDVYGGITELQNGAKPLYYRDDVDRITGYVYENDDTGASFWFDQEGLTGVNNEIFSASLDYLTRNIGLRWYPTNDPTYNSNGWFDLDGSNDYIDLKEDRIISPDNQGWTAEYWFNSDSASTLQHFNSAENDEFNANWLALYNSKLAVWNRSPGYWKYGDTIIQSNTWYQAVFVCDAGGTNMRYYINGVREGGNHVGNSWNATYSSLETRYIGRYEYNNSYSRYFNGKMSKIRMYDRALSDSEVSQNYYGGPIVTDGLTFATDAGNLVSYQNGSTSAYSLTGSIEGTLVNGVGFDNSKGGYWTFDDSDDKITFPNNAVFNHTSELTIESWVKFDGNSNDFIFEKGNVNTQYSLFSHGTDIVFRTYHAGNSGYDTLLITKANADITNGQWHHIVGSWDGSTKRIYVDGQDKGSKSKSGALTTTSQGAAIGAFGGTSSGYYFGGDIAIVRIYNKGLSQDEVLQNFNAQKARFGI